MLGLWLDDQVEWGVLDDEVQCKMLGDQVKWGVARDQLE